MSIAASGGSSLEFAMFWVGILIGFWAIALRILRSNETPQALGEVLVVLGVWGMIPRILRTGLSPFFFDEFDHLRIAQDVVATGHTSALHHLFQLGASFPGLELLTATTALVNPLTLWQTGLLWVMVAHVLGIIGIFTLVGGHRGDAKQGAFAALFYACNPSWFYFHGQFSYETLALPLMIWVLVFAERVWRLGAQRSSVGPFVVVCIALPIVHHATSAALIALLLLWSIACVAIDVVGAQKRVTKSTRRLLLLTLGAMILVIARLLLIGSTLREYWSPVLNLHSISQAFGHLLGHSSSGGRVVFGGTQLPWWEIAAGFLLVPLLLIVLIRSLLQRWRSTEAIDGLEILFWALALAFFISLPLDLVSTLSEAAHRSWGFSFLGLSAIAAGVVQPILQQRKKWKRAMVGAVFAVVAIAGTSIGTSVAYQFPGPVQAGVDGRSFSEETAVVASWFATHSGANDRVFADRFASRQIQLATRADVIMPWQLWQLAYFPELNEYTLRMLMNFQVNYLVFDRRMTTVLPPSGFWYSPNEPPAYLTSVVPPSNLERFQCYDWAQIVASTQNYQIVAVNLDQVRSDFQHYQLGVVPHCTPRTMGTS